MMVLNYFTILSKFSRRISLRFFLKEKPQANANALKSVREEETLCHHLHHSKLQHSEILY